MANVLACFSMHGKQNQDSDSSGAVVIPTQCQWYQLSQSSQHIEGVTLSTDLLHVGHSHWLCVTLAVASNLVSGTIGEVESVRCATTGLAGPESDCFFFLQKVHIQLESALGSVRIPTHCQWNHSSHLSHWIMGVPSSGFVHCGHMYSSNPSSSTFGNLLLGFDSSSTTSSSELCFLSFLRMGTEVIEEESFLGRPLGLIAGGLFNCGLGFCSGNFVDVWIG